MEKCGHSTQTSGRSIMKAEGRDGEPRLQRELETLIIFFYTGLEKGELIF